MLPPFAHNLLYSALDKKWTSSTLKLKRLTPKFYKQWQSLNNISNLQWAMSTLHPLDRPTFKFLTLNGKTSVVWSKWKSNCKKWSYSPLSTQINSWNSVCNHQRVFCSMALLAAVKLCLPRQLLTNVAQTLFQLKAQNYWLCGSVRVRPMSEMSSTRLELLHLAFYFSMS